MSDENSTPEESPLDPTATLGSLQWDQLGAIVDEFWRALEKGDDVDIAEFLPQVPGLRRMALVELVKTELDWRRELGLAADLEEYLRRWPELTTPQVPVDLVVEDVLSQKRHGLPVDVSKLIDRFPHARRALQNLGIDDPFATLTCANAPRPFQLEPGMQIGDFELLSRLGQGSFATVFLARQASLQRLVALKISEDRGFEGQTLAQMEHPNIVRVYDQVSDVDPITGRPVRLMYMQFVPGGSLAQILQSIRRCDRQEWSGRLLVDALEEGLRERGEAASVPEWVRQSLGQADWPTCVALIGAALADALAEAHRQGVLHRDVKPANVLVDRDGTPKLVDFNVSAAERVVGVTAASQFGGSLPYMSPEQLEVLDPGHARRADALGPDTDLYALGVVLFEMLVGHRPFDQVAPTSDWSESLGRMVRLRRDPEISKRLRSELAQCPWPVPAMLIDTILWAVAPNPEQRFDSAECMAMALRMATNRGGAEWVRPATGLGGWITTHPEQTGMAIGAGISAVGASFVVVYNAIQAVPKESFEILVAAIVGIDSIAFASGMAAIYFVGRPIGRFVRGSTNAGRLDGAVDRPRAAFEKPRSGERTNGAGQAPTEDSDSSTPRRPDVMGESSPVERFGGAVDERPSQVRSNADFAIRRNLDVSNRGALICLALWIGAGIAFPSTLTLAGVKLDHWGWLDFLASNLLAGLLSASWAFLLIAWLSVRYWYPAILRRSIRNCIPNVDVGDVKRFRWRIGFYQLVALSVPMLAMVLLIARDDPQTKFALIALSLFSIPGCVIQSIMADRTIRGLNWLVGTTEE